MSRALRVAFLLLTIVSITGILLFLPPFFANPGPDTLLVLIALIAGLASSLLGIETPRLVVAPFKRLRDAVLTEGGTEKAASQSEEAAGLARAFNRMAAKHNEIVSLLTAERDRMALILSQMGDGILVVGANNQVTLINEAAKRILGVSWQAQGHTLAEVVPDYELHELVQRSLQSGVQQNGALEPLRGSRFLGVVATPLETEGCLLLLQDLSQLRRLETVRRDFISNISHELRTPIAALKALAETLEEGAMQDPEVAQDFLGKMGAEADKLAQMVQELSELSRIESGDVRLEKKPFDVGEALALAVNRLKPQADRAGLTLDVDVPPELPTLNADRYRVEQVLINLIHNAIKFTPPEGHITVTAAKDNNAMHVSVADSGIGIPRDDLPRIFERFYKVDKSRAGGGTGLGLAIAKHAVEAHGGRIWAESVEGKGSTFHFAIPLTPSP